MTLDNFKDLWLAMIVAFLLIYSVLVIQFKSFKTSLLIMITIPLAMVWIMPWFAFLDLINWTFLTATSLIWFIALMWIVVNNAILFIEYFEYVKQKWLTVKNSLIEAWRVRLRPILLTSATTVLWSLTIVTNPVWSGLAWSMIFWLSLSTFLTLVVFPVLYNITSKEK